MHYRERAKQTMQKVRAMNAKAVVFVEITALATGEVFYNDHSFFMNYEHKNQRFASQTERERNDCIRASHHIVYDNVLYYAQGISDYGQCTKLIREWHNARKNGSISVYRLD